MKVGGMNPEIKYRIFESFFYNKIKALFSNVNTNEFLKEYRKIKKVNKNKINIKIHFLIFEFFKKYNYLVAFECRLFRDWISHISNYRRRTLEFSCYFNQRIRWEIRFI